MGAKEPMTHFIYLHGFLSGPASTKGKFFEKSFAALGQCLIIPDLNGEDFSEMTISRQLQLIDSLLGSLSGRIVLLGSSLGGYLAAFIAGKYESVMKLVLLAPAFDFVTRYFQRLTPTQRQEWKKNGFIQLYHHHYREHRALGYQIVTDAQKYKNLPLRLTVPTLIFHGLNDEAVPYQVSLDFVKNHPSAELMLLHSDHGLYDQLDKMWDHIKVFLQLK